MMQNFNIFISHDSRDEAIAAELKKFLENIFYNANVYVSGRDLEGGQTWIEKIKGELKSSHIIIALLTKTSIQNNWIYFESGVGFTDDRTIPLTGFDVKIGKLTPPMSLLQARSLSNNGIEFLIKDISSKLDFRAPTKIDGKENFLLECEKYFVESKLNALMDRIPKTEVTPSAIQWIWEKQALVYDYKIKPNYRIAVDVYSTKDHYEIVLLGRDPSSYGYLFDTICKANDFLPKAIEKYERKKYHGDRTARLVFERFDSDEDIEKVAQTLIGLLLRIEEFKKNIESGP